MPETELQISTTTDTQPIAQAAADGDEKGARVPAPKPDSADSVSFEHPRSERTMLLERLAAHESDLEALSSSDADYVTTSNEAEKQLGGEETGKEAAADKAGIDMAKVREAATADAIEAGRRWAASQQQNAHVGPTPAQMEAEAEAIRAQARPAFQKRFAELTKGIDPKQLRVDIPIPKIVEDALLTLPGGPEATLFLAQNPAEAQKLQSVPEHLALAHVAQLTARLNPDFHRRPTSNAPPPIRPIGGSSTKSSVPPDEMSYQDYRRMRDAQEKNRYKR